MNSPNNLETLLRGFRPRRPSDRVRNALFGRPDATLRSDAAEGPPPTRLLQVWFAPIAATAVAILSVGSVLLPSGSPVVEELAFAALGAGWQSNVVQVERNLPPRPSFHSTTGAAVAPSFGSLLLRQTNVLAR